MTRCFFNLWPASVLSPLCQAMHQERRPVKRVTYLQMLDKWRRTPAHLVATDLLLSGEIGRCYVNRMAEKLRLIRETAKEQSVCQSADGSPSNHSTISDSCWDAALKPQLQIATGTRVDCSN